MLLGSIKSADNPANERRRGVNNSELLLGEAPMLCRRLVAGGWGGERLSLSDHAESSSAEVAFDSAADSSLFMFRSKLSPEALPCLASSAA